MTFPLKALTLTEPWAILCVAPFVHRFSSTANGRPVIFDIGHVAKIHETRGFRLGTVPLRVAIHAGKGPGDMREFVTRAGELVPPFSYAVKACGYSCADPWLTLAERLSVRSTGDPLPLGAIIGLVTFTAVERTEVVATTIDPLNLELGNYEPGRWAWTMEEPWLAPVALPCRGFQQLWNVSDADQARLREMGGTW